MGKLFVHKYDMGICTTTEEDTPVLHESDYALSNAALERQWAASSSASAAAFGPKAAVESVKTAGDREGGPQEPTSPSVERLNELDKEREQIDDKLKAVLHDVAGAASTSPSPSSPSPQVPAAESSSPPATEAQVPEVFSPLTSAKSEVKAAEQYMNSIEQSPARFGYQNPKSKEYLSELEKAQSSVLDGRQNVKS